MPVVVNYTVLFLTLMLQLVDSEVVMLSAHWEKKRSSLLDLQEQLQQIPGFLSDLESTTANLGKTVLLLEMPLTDILITFMLKVQRMNYGLLF